MREEREQLSQQDMEVHHQWAEHPLHLDLVRSQEEAAGADIVQELRLGQLGEPEEGLAAPHATLSSDIHE